MKYLQSNKSFEHESLTKKFYGGFLDEMEEFFIASVTEAKTKVN